MLTDEDLGDVSGGAGNQSFSRLAEDFARENRCKDCPYKQVSRPHEMCMEVYGRLLMDYSGGGAAMRCMRRP